MKISEIFNTRVGPLQSRIQQSLDDDAPVYKLYGQENINQDLTGIYTPSKSAKQIRTFDEVITLKDGEIVYNLISGVATVVGKRHEGYVFSQNIAVLTPRKNKKVSGKFIVYLLNEDRIIKKQLLIGLQGTKVLKHTIKQIRELQLSKIPNYERQVLIGEIYFNQLRVQALRQRKVMNETKLKLAEIEEILKR